MIVLAIHASAFILQQLLLRRVEELAGVDAQPALLPELLRRDPALAAQWLRQAYLVVALDDLAIACATTDRPNPIRPLDGLAGSLDQEIDTLRTLTRRVRCTGLDLVHINPRPSRPTV